MRGISKDTSAQKEMVKLGVGFSTTRQIADRL